MNDIVERLESDADCLHGPPKGGPCPVCTLEIEAAAEIRRLREQVRVAREALGEIEEECFVDTILDTDIGHIEAVARKALTQLAEPTTEGEEPWLPTAANINALPDPVRDYIHRLETRCDPASEVRELVIAKDTIRALESEKENDHA